MEGQTPTEAGLRKIPTPTGRPMAKNYRGTKMRVLHNASPIKSFKKGGMVHKTGIYRLHKGEAVVPKHVVDKKVWMMSEDGIAKK